LATPGVEHYLFLRALAWVFRCDVGLQRVLYVCSWVSLHASEAPLDGDQRWSVMNVALCYRVFLDDRVLYMCVCWQSSPRAKNSSWWDGWQPSKPVLEANLPVSWG
jgi:hypothetical protein